MASLSNAPAMMMAASLSSHFSSISLTAAAPPRILTLTLTPPPSPSSSSSFPHRRGTTAGFLNIFSGQHRLSSSSVRFAAGTGGGGEEGSAGGGRVIDTTFFDNLDPEQEYPFQPAERPEGYVPPPYFDEGPPESEDEVAAAYEEIYGPAYSGVSVLGNNVNVMDAKMKKAASGFGSKRKKEKVRDGFEERVVQVRRVTKVVKGGKQLHFRAIVVVGDKKGSVGVGVGKAKEVISAVDKSATNARRNVISVPMTKYSTFPHRSDGDYGAAKVMLRPASPGTGVIAGGAVRIVLEMAGVENALGKQLGSKNALNNARATVVAVQKMRQFSDVARDRGIPMEELWK